MTKITLCLKPDNNDETIKKVPGTLILCLHLDINKTLATSGLNLEPHMTNYQVEDF